MAEGKSRVIPLPFPLPEMLRRKVRRTRPGGGKLSRTSSASLPPRPSRQKFIYPLLLPLLPPTFFFFLGVGGVAVARRKRPEGPHGIKRRKRNAGEGGKDRGREEVFPPNLLSVFPCFFYIFFPCGKKKQFRLVSEAASRFLSVRLFLAVSQARSRVCSNFGDLLLTLRDPLSSKTSVTFPFLQLSPPYPSEKEEFTKNVFIYYIVRKSKTSLLHRSKLGPKMH